MGNFLKLRLNIYHGVVQFSLKAFAEEIAWLLFPKKFLRFKFKEFDSKVTRKVAQKVTRKVEVA